jgi:hypothetical protein
MKVAACPSCEALMKSCEDLLISERMSVNHDSIVSP